MQMLPAIPCLWNIFRATVADPGSNNAICIIDGLDECDKASQNDFEIALAEYFKDDDRKEHIPSLKILITSRPDNTI